MSKKILITSLLTLIIGQGELLGATKKDFGKCYTECAEKLISCIEKECPGTNTDFKKFQPCYEKHCMEADVACFNSCS